MEIIFDIAVTHPQGADAWVGMWPLTLRRALKSRYENSSNYSNSLTTLSEKRLVILRKALKEVPKTLAEVVTELWTARAAAKKLMEQTEQVQSEPDQQKWRGTQLSLNQPTMESFWQSPTRHQHCHIYDNSKLPTRRK